MSCRGPNIIDRGAIFNTQCGDTGVRERQWRWLRQQRVPVEAHLLGLWERLVSYDTALAAHSIQVSQLARVLAQYLVPQLEPTYIAAGALLHDIGKICLPWKILHQAPPLAAAQERQVRWHPRYGLALLARTPSLLDLWPGVLCHHERWDGQGELGLRQEEIPLEGRLVALADALSSLITHRMCAPLKTWAQAVEELRGGAGRQYDPYLMRLLNDNAGEIARRAILGSVNLEEVLAWEKGYLGDLYHRFGHMHHAAVYIQSLTVDHLVVGTLRRKA